MSLSRHVQRLRDDEGSSLIELLVGIALMAVFGAMFSGAVFMMTNSAKTAQSITETSTRLSTAFVKLDKTARYAAAFGEAARSNGDWYVEFRTTNNGTTVCTQLRVSNKRLESRTWTVLAAGASAPTGWDLLAQGITNGDVVSAVDATADRPLPFERIGTTSNSATYPSLKVSLVAVAVAGDGSTTSDASTTSMSVMTYPAVNGTTNGADGCGGELRRP